MHRSKPDRKYLACAKLLTTVMSFSIRQSRAGMENVPSSGPVIICANHVSYVDPVVLAHALIDYGAHPYFLAKKSLFSVPVIGFLLKTTRQLPVDRNDSSAGGAFAAAENVLERGRVLAVFPEGTITRRDDYWPMPARSGAARLALRTGATVVPTATWGGQEIAPAYGRGRLRLFTSNKVSVRFGKPIVFGQESDPSDATVDQVSHEIMSKIVAELSVLRQQRSPLQEN